MLVFELDLIREIERLHAGLHTLSYYDVLGLSRSTDYVAIREAFYARAQRFHPDRYVGQTDLSLKAAVYALFKRMTEAYNVLSDPELRAKYDVALSQGECRLPAGSRGRRIGNAERRINNAFARIYFRAASEKFAQGEWTGAWIDVELGLSLEESEPLRKLHSEIVRRAALSGV
ncbi:MAG: J domain-containing protein [Nannocystaceae bacterium]